ncbi:MAG: ferritin family protein [Proteobacteria bacterium]|nr:ferritin family protein [Pseudomonadota bacterium]
MFTTNDLLDIAVKMEKNGKAVYEHALGEIQNKKLRKLLSWMALEEENHQKWFLGQKNRRDPEAVNFSEMLPDVLQEMMGEKSLSLEEVDFSKITHTTQMLTTFIEFENDTILFYEFLGSFIRDKKTLGGLKDIIREETAHVESLNEMIQAVREADIPEETLSF